MKSKSFVVTGIASVTVPVDHKQNPFTLSFSCEITGTATYTFYYTLSDLRGGATPVWKAHSAGLTAATTNQDGNLNNGPCTAVKLDVTASTGSVKLNLHNPTNI